MRGRHGAYFHVMQESQDTDGKCRTFHRIRSGTDFIK